MKKIALVAGLALVLCGAAQAGEKNTQLALFQEHTIFRSGITHAHTIALTFDDGPNAHTDEVLDALKEMHVKATFFIVGKQARKNPQILARIAREGHLLANHSATHAFLGGKYDENPDMLLNQIRDGQGALVWSQPLGGWADEARASQWCDKQVTFDPDLWIVEIEDARGRAFVDEPIL